MKHIYKNYLYFCDREVGYLGDVLIIAELGINYKMFLKLGKKWQNFN